MTDSESDSEEGSPSSVAVMAGHKRAAPQANRPGSKKQAAQRSAEPDSGEDCFMAAQTTDRTGQPSSHQPGEASGSGQADNSVDRAAFTQQQRGKRRLRTAGGKLVGQEKPAPAHAAPAPARQPSNQGRSAFSFDRPPEDENVEADLS